MDACFDDLRRCSPGEDAISPPRGRMSPRRLSLIVILLFFLQKLISFSSSFRKNYDVNLSPIRSVSRRERNITLLVVLNSATDANEYEFPLSTIQCYARRHGYVLKVLKDTKFSVECPQKDYFFRRHCVSSTVLRRSPETEWLLFLDADIAVVNPSRRVEEYLDAEAQLIMYDRFFGWEIAMGSYLAKNTPWTREFLLKFSYFENQLPTSFHGTDNGAIHAYILRELEPASIELARPCFEIWETSTGYSDLFLYEACVRSILGTREKIGEIRIIPKARGWVRDGWITKSRWSPKRDFMLHGYKSSDRRWNIPLFNSLREPFSFRFGWYSFLRTELTAECRWDYDNDLRVSEEEINEILVPLHRHVKRRYWRTLGLLSSYL